MAIVYECDGCGQRIEEAALLRVGELNPVHYCGAETVTDKEGTTRQTITGGCAQVWAAYQADETEERVKVIQAFEDWRERTRAGLRGTRLRKLPDE